ncbi:MAG: hypothetical protein U1F60_04145 [Planctomycetota bacterium]
MTNLSLATPVLAIALTGSLLAQSDGSYWNEYPLPSNLTNVRQLGSLVLLETPTEYHLYSGQHRKWTVHPVTAPVLIGVANKQCLWKDSGVVYAYSTFSGVVEALPVSGTAVVNMGSLSSSWTSYVQDGTDVWAFSAFFGEWRHLAMSQTPTVGIGSHSVSAYDGLRAYAFSAFYGDWVALPTYGPSGTFTWRNGVFATFSAPDLVAAFSCYTNTWNTIAFPTSGISFDARDAFASVSRNSGTERLWFSVLRGIFTTTNLPGSTTTFGPSVAIVSGAGGETYGYAPGNGTLAPLPVLPGATQTVAGGSFGACAVFDDGVALSAFSGLLGTFSVAPNYYPATWTVGDTEAFATGASGEGMAYSAIRGDWTVAPNAVASATVANFECILRTLPYGYQAYSARTGTFVDRSSPTGSPTLSGSVVMLGTGSIIGIVDGNVIDVFDPRYARWMTQFTGPNPTFGVHRLAGIGHDGVNGYATSLWSYFWEQIPLQGTVTGLVVNSSIGYVRTTSHIYVYTATGSLSTFARFPEFSRFHALGQPISHNQIGNPGAFCYALLSTIDGETPTNFGLLRVDPVTPIILPLGLVPPNGRLYTPIPTPDIPSLRGVNLFMQDALQMPNGDLVLTNGLSHYLW